jgi:hypothetical protein
VSRGRLAAVVLVLTAAGVAPTTAQAAHFAYTHRVTVTGQLVDHWTVDDPSSCGPVGDGTATVTFQVKKAYRARVYIDRYANSEVNDRAGTWILVAPQGPFHQVTDVRAQPASGTVDLVDNSTLRPPPGGDCGTPADKSGCGTHPLSGAMSEVGRYDRHRIAAGLQTGELNRNRQGDITCPIGSLEGFSEPPSIAGGTRTGQLLLKMPSARTLAHRHVVKVTGTSHKVTTSPHDPGSPVYTDDVTRTVTVTFTRL